jgi:hypothetical protein
LHDHRIHIPRTEFVQGPGCGALEA